MGTDFIEELKMIGILWMVVVGYIISGTASGCFVKHENFDVKKFLNGICKSIIACGNLIIIAYILTIIDLSSLGFNSSTIINSGIIVYSTKILRNSLYLLGITKDGKEKSNEGSILSGVDELDGDIDNDQANQLTHMLDDIPNYDLDAEDDENIDNGESVG